jgi:competence protein ComEC
MGVQVFWAITSGFLIGVFFRSFVPFGWWAILFCVLCAVLVGVSAYISRTQLIKGVAATTLLGAVAAGSARMHGAVLESDPILNQSVGEKIVIEGVVTEESDMRENNVRLSVQTDSKVGVLVIAPLHTSIEYGDRIRAEGELRLPEAFEAGAGREFNYPAYLAKDGILYEMSFAQVEKIGDARRNPFKVAAIWLKQTYLEGLALALPEPEAGLAGGITAGDKRGLGAELSETFRTVGLIHIVVLSGYNIMVVIGFLERLFRRAHRYVQFGLGIFVAALFALMTGLASSSVRAASMAVIAGVGKTTGRTYLAARALAVVAMGMVLWDPYLLAFDPGFQLSVIATVGLMALTPIAVARLGFVTERFGLREIAAATIGTQIAVLPLILYQSGSLSLYSLPANLLALVVVPYAMLLSFIAGVFGFFLGPLAVVVGFPAYILLWYVVSIGEFFAWLPFASLTIPAFSAIWLFALYVVLISGTFMLKKRAAGPKVPPHP